MQKVGNQLLKIKKQKTTGWSQYSVGDTGSSIGRQIHNIHELIEKPATIKLNRNKQMPCDIKQSKKFLSHMRIVTGRPVLMAHTDFIGEGIYVGAGIRQTGVQY